MMDLDSMIAVLEAAKAGKQIEQQCKGQNKWFTPHSWDFEGYNYRIAPEKERGLVEQLRLRAWGASPGNMIQRAADRIEELEAELLNISNGVLRMANKRIEELEKNIALLDLHHTPTDELLDEIKRRVTNN